MYLTFYGLKEKPSNPTPDLPFLFLAPGHREALAQLLSGVRGGGARASARGLRPAAYWAAAASVGVAFGAVGDRSGAPRQCSASPPADSTPSPWPGTPCGI